MKVKEYVKVLWDLHLRAEASEISDKENSDT